MLSQAPGKLFFPPRGGDFDATKLFDRDIVPIQPASPPARPACSCLFMPALPVMPAKAGISSVYMEKIPAFAGRESVGVGISQALRPPLCLHLEQGYVRVLGMKSLTPLLQAIIAFCAVFTALGLMFNILLRPVKENQARMGKDMDHFKQELGHFKQDLYQLKVEMDQFKVEMDQFKVEVNVKLDKLLSKNPY